MSAEEVAARTEAGQPVTVLDARSPQAWGESRQKVRGAIRGHALTGGWDNTVRFWELEK
jgi:hypothetical protein